MFRRSYDIEYDPEHKKMFLTDVFCTLEMSPYAMRVNHRPYDMFKARKVKTLHYVVRYDEKHYQYDKVEVLKRQLLKQGFFIQENPKSEKSVDEIDHFHAIKILCYLPRSQWLDFLDTQDQ